MNFLWHGNHFGRWGLVKRSLGWVSLGCENNLHFQKDLMWNDNTLSDILKLFKWVFSFFFWTLEVPGELPRSVIQPWLCIRITWGADTHSQSPGWPPDPIKPGLESRNWCHVPNYFRIAMYKWLLWFPLCPSHFWTWVSTAMISVWSLYVGYMGQIQSPDYKSSDEEELYLKKHTW